MIETFHFAVRNSPQGYFPEWSAPSQFDLWIDKNQFSGLPFFLTVKTPGLDLVYLLTATGPFPSLAARLCLECTYSAVCEPSHVGVVRVF
jgi:hypothetical protein